MGNNDKHYMALGLWSGATQEEIRSAFERIAELYHPDRDASLDAQMRCHDARMAYKALSASNNVSNANDNFSEILEFERDISEKEDKLLFSDTPLYDYFFRLKLVITVVGSIVVLFAAVRYFTPIPFTDESSARLLRHTAIFLFVAWPIFWYARYTFLKVRIRVIAFVPGLLLGFVYGFLVSDFTLSQETFFILINGSLDDRWYITRLPTHIAIHFMFMFFFATHFLEKEGMIAELKKTYRAFIYILNLRNRMSQRSAK